MNEKLYYNAANIAAMLGVEHGKILQDSQRDEQGFGRQGISYDCRENPCGVFQGEMVRGSKGGGYMSCNAKKDPNGTWRIQYRWTDWTGEKKKSQKRGFKTKKEAEEWYAHFLLHRAD